LQNCYYYLHMQTKYNMNNKEQKIGLCKITYDEIRQNHSRLQNFGCFCQIYLDRVVSMHIHNAIQTNYAYKGIRGGS